MFCCFYYSRGVSFFDLPPPSTYYFTVFLCVPLGEVLPEYKCRDVMFPLLIGRLKSGLLFYEGRCKGSNGVYGGE